MFTTLPTDRIHLPGKGCPSGEILSASVLAPPDVGLLIVDMCWSETTTQERTQGALFPATIEAVARIHAQQTGICGITYIPPARHDGSGRDPSIQVDAIDAARDPQRSYAYVLLVRDTAGSWHPCNSGTNMDALDDRIELMRVNELF